MVGMQQERPEKTARHVSGRAVTTVLELGAMVNIPAEVLLEGMPFNERDLRGLGYRVTWDQNAEVIDRLERLCPLGTSLEALGQNVPQTAIARELGLLAGMFVGPLELYLFATRHLAPFLYANIRSSTEERSDGRLCVQVEIPPGYRPCLGYFRLTLGSFRAIPVHLGLPHAEVEAELGPSCATYLVRAPPSRTILARGKRFLVRRKTLQMMEEYLLELHQKVSELSQANERLRAQSLALEEEVSQRRRLDAALLGSLDALPGSAFLVTPEGKISAANAAGRAALQADANGVLLEELLEARQGRLAEGLECSPMEGHGLPGHFLIVRNDRAALLSRKVLFLSDRWKLTARQKEVLDQLVRGRSNKEVAARLDCTEATVEAHVTQTLRKARVHSRAELQAQFWTSG